jgi:hypothetical protein
MNWHVKYVDASLAAQVASMPHLIDLGLSHARRYFPLPKLP